MRRFTVSTVAVFVVTWVVAWAGGARDGAAQGKRFALAEAGLGGPPPPVSLTGSDGTGLHLVSLTARGVVEDPLAFTELPLVFRNPTPRQIEGRFEIALPA